MLTLQGVADELRRRLIAIFLPGAGRPAPALRRRRALPHDPEWQDLLEFHEYFHGDDGAGLGASHQTGWTGLVAALIADGGRPPGPPPVPPRPRPARPFGAR